jgi:hypothetical protein
MLERLSLTFALVLFSGRAAYAGPALDYSAAAACPDAGRFADEVSARVGSVAFSELGEAFVVRLIGSADEYTGTLEYAGGSKIVHGASCADAFDELVAASAVLLDGQPPVSGGVLGSVTGLESLLIPSDKATVVVTSSKPELMVAQVDGRASGSGYGAGGSVSYQAVYYRDLCVAPCTAEVEPGVAEIGVYGAPTVA